MSVNILIPALDSYKIMGEQGFDLFTLFVYFIQLAPSRGAFLAEMAKQETGQNDRATKLALMTEQQIGRAKNWFK